MPVLRFCQPTESNAIGALYSSQDDERYGPFAYWVRPTFVGCCLQERENNGYHDSDFFMLVWDEEQQAARWIEFASTRGWCYPLFGSRVDATPEVRAKYDAWRTQCAVEQRKRDRRAQAQIKLKLRCEMKAAAAKHGFPYPRLLKLRKANTQVFEGTLKLLGQNLRSEFKKSLLAQALKWLQDPAPKYNTPFSKKQAAYLPSPHPQTSRYYR